MSLSRRSLLVGTGAAAAVSVRYTQKLLAGGGFAE